MRVGAGAAFMCSCGNGYDGSLMTAINGMVPYQDRFNQGRDSLSPPSISMHNVFFDSIKGQLDVSTGIIFSIYTIGQMAGS